MSHIAFIGLGHMGLPMARNLLQAGHVLTVHDLSPAAVAAAVAAGATAAETVTEAVAKADAVITMLPAGPQVRAVYLGSVGVIAGTSRRSLLIDCSTIDVASAREVAAAARRAGIAMVDAPVSGGVAGAAAGTLTFMVGGPDAAVERARPLLEVMGKAVIHAGAAGAGQAAKICNNMLLGISMIGTCEAFVLAETLGLSADKLFEIASRASGQCWSLTSYCPVPGPVPASPANRGYEPGFTAAMMLKDLGLATDAGAGTPLGAAAAALYRQFVEGGGGGRDFSGIIAMLRQAGRTGGES